MSNVTVTINGKTSTSPIEHAAATVPDAGLKEQDHYVRKLSPSRYRLRQALLPILRWETPYLKRMQDLCRTSFLDSYFALTANLGTHTFFMTALPIMFWCGYTDVGRALVNMLALGVFLSGVIKDLVCLPRPLSPPLHRITMSGSAALEYGFPSTHSTNAVSVAAFFLYHVHNDNTSVPPQLRTAALVSGYAYATSIIIGRMYCGMHGLFDVIIGSVLGGLITVLQVSCGDAFDIWIAENSWHAPLLATVLVIAAVRFHPEPADNCPCFDDSVAFAGVLIGCQIGHWSFSRSPYSLPVPTPATVAFHLQTLGIAKAALRIVLGVTVIFLWRAVMKPLLLRCLPPLFRTIEQRGFSLPRRFFTNASQYKRVPPLRKDDNVIPPAADIAGMLSSLRHRKRAISIGPQSEADAREFIAHREHKRRHSRSTSDQDRRPFPSGTSILADLPSPIESMEDPIMRADSGKGLQANGISTEEHSQEEARQDRQMFLALEKPRVRYDVEVVTKIVVYAGIAWLAVEGNPLLFENIGLGMARIATI